MPTTADPRRKPARPMPRPSSTDRMPMPPTPEGGSRQEAGIGFRRRGKDQGQCAAGRERHRDGCTPALPDRGLVRIGIGLLAIGPGSSVRHHLAIGVPYPPVRAASRRARPSAAAAGAVDATGDAVDMESFVQQFLDASTGSAGQRVEQRDEDADQIGRAFEKTFARGSEQRPDDHGAERDQAQENDGEEHSDQTHRDGSRPPCAERYGQNGRRAQGKVEQHDSRRVGRNQTEWKCDGRRKECEDEGADPAVPVCEAEKEDEESLHKSPIRSEGPRWGRVWRPWPPDRCRRSGRHRPRSRATGPRRRR